VDHFIAWAGRGPAMAVVTNVTVINMERPGMGSSLATSLGETINGE